MPCFSGASQVLDKALCSAVASGLHLTRYWKTRVFYILITNLSAGASLLFKACPWMLSSIQPFTQCESPECLSTLATHSLMLSSSLFHLLFVLLSSWSCSAFHRFYHNYHFLKFILYVLVIPICFILLSKHVSPTQDFYFWTCFIFAGLFVPFICVNSVEMFYDWNDTWYENYSDSGSKIWALLLISSSTLCWCSNIFLLFASYFSNSFLYALVYFVSSVVLVALSSSSICENGCKGYTALLSCSASVTLGFYFYVTGITGYKEITYVAFNVVWTGIVMSYFALSHVEREKPEHTQINTTEMKNFKDLEETKIEEVAKKREGYKDVQVFSVYMVGYAVYLGMVISLWENDGFDSVQAVVLISSGLICFLFYIWTLVVPIVFPDRDLTNSI